MGSCTSRVRGGLFRDGNYHKYSTVGKRRVKDGECAAIWNRKGEVRNVVGPKLVRVFLSDVRFLDRFVANQNQYLVVCFRDGRKEHVRGPSALFLDPVVHKSVEVKEAISLNTQECLVVYRETDNRRDSGILAPAEESKEHARGWPVLSKISHESALEKAGQGAELRKKPFAARKLDFSAAE